MMIGIDFDGTICEDPKDKYPMVGAPMLHALPVIRALHRAGHQLFIWSLRSRNAREERPMLEFMWEHGLVGILRQEPVNPYGKPPFDCFIDDRNFGGFPGWLKVAAEFNVLQLLAEELDKVKKHGS